jgi:hypothetical protein
MKILKRLLLINRDDLKRYTAYAVFEVSLVVVGILIAVMINDWNEARKERRIEQTLLVSLSKEMVANYNFLSTVIHYQEISRDASLKLLEIYGSDYRKFDTRALDSLFGAVQWAWSFEPKVSVLNSIKATGKIDVIKDENIKTFVTSFEESTKNAQSISLFMRNFMREQYVPSVSRFISQRNRVTHLGFPEVKDSMFPAQYKELFSDREVESHLTYVYVWRKDEVYILKSIQSELKKSMDLVNSSIEQ